jgi:positive regulator of sigma E activity
MSFSGTIEHEGVISQIGKNSVRVSISPVSACGSCRAKGSCSIGSSGERFVDVSPAQGETYRAGQPIRVVLDQSLGIKALGLGYFLPFLAVLALLILLTAAGMSEGAAGILSLAVLIPYYLGLSLFRKRFKKDFSFRLEKI